MRQFLFIAVAALSLTACQPSVQQKVFGRHVPERKDDFAWENEYAAFRLYGPALKPENPSNGVDLWLKAAPELIVDSFYYRELVQGYSYHVNYGKGLDCYKVAHTSGCGGLVVMTEDQPDHLWIGGPYDRWEIVEQTPEKLVFRLEYDSLQVDGHILHESLTITAEAGHALNMAQVVLTNPQSAEKPDNLWVGGGIYLHDTIDHMDCCEHCGVIAYAENAVSDPTSARLNYEYNGSTSQGRTYAAVILDHPAHQEIIEGTLVAVRPYQLGDTLTYWFGGCWSEWHDGDRSFPTDEDWFTAASSLR